MDFSENFKEYLDSIGAREQIATMLDEVKQLKEQVSELNASNSNLLEEKTRLQEKVETLSQRTVPVGTILSYGGRRESIPNGWLLCDGQWLNTDQNTALFAAIGHAWGKDSNNPQKFRIPDLRGRFLRGVDYEAGLDPNSKDRKNGEGLPDVGSMQGDATRRPNHAFSGNTTSNGGHEHLFHRTDSKSRRQRLYGGTDARVVYIESTSHVDAWTRHGGGHSHTVAINGGDAETRPKNAYVNFIIRIK